MVSVGRELYFLGGKKKREINALVLSSQHHLYQNIKLTMVASRAKVTGFLQTAILILASPSLSSLSKITASQNHTFDLKTKG